MKNPYSKADKTIEYINKQYIKLFDRMMATDELNVIASSYDIYDSAYKLIEQESARLVKSVYKSYRKGDDGSFDPLAFVLVLLLAYNPVTKYVFKNELDRKRSRFAEGVIASDTPMEEVALAKRLLLGITAQFLDDTTFDGMVQAYKDNGTKEVKWVTAEDDKRCKECKSRHGLIYKIDKIPPKPHIHCRCWVEEVKGDEK
jgi:SPP1 gp7 family putative phage head morphogenesis protein